jgi:hypothetical protein
MRTALASLAAALAVAAISGADIGAQQTRKLFVSVTSASGAPIDGLPADAFTVVEDGMAAKTIKAEPVTWPVKLTLLVDNGSQASEYIQDLRAALHNFFDAIHSDVETTLITVAPQPRFIVRPTRDRDQLSKGIDLITPDPGIGKFFDGVREAADRAVKDKSDFFPVFFVISSNLSEKDPPLDFQIKKTQQQLLDRAATVHFIQFTTKVQSGAGVTGAITTDFGIALTQLTGGRYENINSYSRLRTLLPEYAMQIERSITRQAHQYRVTYTSAVKMPNSFSVKVNAPPASVIDVSADGHLP